MYPAAAGSRYVTLHARGNGRGMIPALLVVRYHMVSANVKVSAAPAVGNLARLGFGPSTSDYGLYENLEVGWKVIAKHGSTNATSTLT